MVKTPGFCRHVEKEWLEQSLRWVANGASSAQLNNSLDNFLSGYIVSKENRRKARNLLTSVWTQPVDQYIKNFFDKGITYNSCKNLKNNTIKKLIKLLNNKLIYYVIVFLNLDLK